MARNPLIPDLDRTATLRRLIGLVDAYTESGFFQTGKRGELRRALVEELEELNRIVWRLMDETQRRKYYAARFCYRHRNENTPGGARRDEKNQVIGPVPWPEWFRQIFGDDLETYMNRCREWDTLKEVYEYELATFGRSALELDMQRREQRHQRKERAA